MVFLSTLLELVVLLEAEPLFGIVQSRLVSREVWTRLEKSALVVVSIWQFSKD